MSPIFAAFCHGSNTERSLSIDASQAVNCFRSTVEAPGAAKAAYLLGTPGLKPLGTAATISCRGKLTQDGRLWSVEGAAVNEETIDPTTGLVTSTPRGSIANDGAPVSMAINGDGGQQLVIVGGGELKILNLLTNVLSAAIALPLTRRPVQVGYLDGYFLVSEANSPIIWFSAIENGTLWDALDFFTRSTASDHVVSFACANSRAWVFGSETSEAYEDVGDADNPFQPIKGSLFQIGSAATWSLSVGVSTMRWLGRSSIGGQAVYRLDGYAGTRISTHAIEAALGAATTLADAEGLTYDQDGHLFYALTCPSLGVAGATYVIDETEQQWHQRSARNVALGRDERWRVRGHAYVGMQHLVGSWDSGAIWALDLNTYDDDGVLQRLVRRAPYLGSENTLVTLDRVELGCEPGVGLGTGQGSDPQVELRISKDSAKTWWSAGSSAMGAIGAHGTCVYWTRLGQVRLDRLVLEIVITDPVKRVLGPGLWIDVTPGRSMKAVAGAVA